MEILQWRHEYTKLRRSDKTLLVFGKKIKLLFRMYLILKETIKRMYMLVFSYKKNKINNDSFFLLLEFFKKYREIVSENAQ